MKAGTNAPPDEARLDPGRIPAHVAIIMDGNGRWARARGISRIRGHWAGAESIREIVRAVNRFVSEHPGEPVTEESLAQYLDTAGIPDPDLIIRTGGEYRISNFLMWESAYSELYFTDVLWPDFSEKDIDEAVAEYRHRDRRFGGVKA